MGIRFGLRAHVCALAALAVTTLLLVPAFAQAQQTVEIYPGVNIQSVVNVNPAGTRFVLKSGMHRMQTITPRSGDTFAGETGTVLSGARLLTTFSRYGQFWVADGQNQEGLVQGWCRADYPRCIYPEDFFIDSQRLRPVSSLAELATGMWYFDYAANRIYFADDPTGRVVETSVTPAAIDAHGSMVENVTITGLIIEKYASPAGTGAIAAPNGHRWLVQYNEVRWNHSVGIIVSDGSRVLNNRAHHNGQVGIGAFDAPDMLIQDNEAAYNGAFFYQYWAAGGIKLGYASSTIIRRNWVHHNIAGGIWCDTECVNVTIEDNTVDDNLEEGIQYEISFAAIIRNNLIRRNGFGLIEGPAQAGIYIFASQDVEVYGNTLIDNKWGIVGFQSQRGSSELSGRPFQLQNLYIHDNSITMSSGIVGGIIQFTGDLTYYTSRNNRFENNTYYGPLTANSFYWMNGYVSKETWQTFHVDAPAIVPIEVAITPGMNIQSIVNVNSLGTRFVLKAGVHRLQTITPRNGDMFVGEPGTVLSGARQLTTFSQSGQYWFVDGQTQEGGRLGVCRADYPRCTYPEDFFIDNQRLIAVGSLAEVIAGRWFFDYAADRIYFADNPAGRLVETSVTPSAFLSVGLPVTDVAIGGLVIEKYASPAGTGSIAAPNGRNWLVQYNEIRMNHSVGVVVGAGSKVMNNNVHHNGQIGISAYNAAGLTVQDNEVSYNGTFFYEYWSAGGIRLGLAANATVRNNYSHHNLAAGIWCLTDCNTVTITGNTVDDNLGPGIQYQDSYNGTITNNTIRRNGLGVREGPARAGIYVSASTNVLVVGNTLVDNAWGIIGFMPAPAGRPYRLEKFLVHHNAVKMPSGVMGGVLQFAGDITYYTARGNHFEANEYRGPQTSTSFYWMDAYASRLQWQTYVKDQGGTFLP